MSYDLYFIDTAESDKATADEFRAWFERRDHVTVQGAQAWYANEDTGVYFSFELQGAGDDGDALPAWASFNLNLYRPHYFALEAAAELEAFVERFGSLVTDPQSAAERPAPFSRERFVAGWNGSNAKAFQLLLRGDEAIPRPLTLPTERLEAIWRWNRERREMQERIAEDVFVPKIFFLQTDGSARAAVAWPDAIPIVLPEVDMLVLLRDEIAPRRFLRKQSSMALARREDLRSPEDAFEPGVAALPFLRARYSEKPKDLLKFFIEQPPLRGDLPGVGNDQVLNEELLTRLG